MVTRVKDPKTGEFVDRRVTDIKASVRAPISSIKFLEGNVYVNGDFAPELTNTLKSVIKGTVQLSTGQVPRQVYGQPTFLGPASQQVSALSADGVRVTDSLVRTYISQLEKQSGQKGTLLPTKLEYGPELYKRLFGSAEELATRDPMKREPTVVNVRKLAANLYTDEKFTAKNLPKDAIYVGRAYNKGKYQLQGTPWGNPYRVGPDGNLEQVLDKYEGWARTQLAKNPQWLDPLMGKDLVDWCEPGKCHADVLKKLVGEKVGDFERAPLGKATLTDADKVREEYNRLNDKKTRLGAAGISKSEARKLNRLEETIRKATTVDPTLVEVEDTRNWREPDEVGKIEKAKTKSDVKVDIKSIGDTKAPGIYTDGKYNSAVTYGAIQAMVKSKENKSFWQTVARQGGIRVAGVFVSVEQMQTLAKSIPVDTEVIYNKSGNPTVKPRTTGGGAFGIANKTLGTLGIIGAIGDILRLSKEWSGTERKVPIS
jgi:hypothetical protein